MQFWACFPAHRDYSDQNQQSTETNHNQSKTKAERYATDVLGQKGYEFVDETTGRFIPNPNTGTFSNARRLGEVYKP